ncbi:SAM-dependent methyltransferase [Streptomyces sp. NPDC008150]|uniref:class I SAM-dependent methyltransferase n=1 Tax=Streptomyces sp. NPDC008150 TaxID=3364816 RepID=UPI0036E58B08
MQQENPTLTMIREFVALGRAEFERPRSPSGDDHGQRKLTEGMTAAGPDGEPVKMSEPLLQLLAPRAPYFDQLVQGALESGVTQIVNVGAGYDDRALRFRSPDVHFYEIDLPHVIADKKRRLDASGLDTRGITLVEADLATDDTGDVLAAAGHDPRERSLFLLEHIVLFLENSAVDRLVRSLAGRAAPGSTLALTAEVHPQGLDSAQVLATTDQVMFGGTSPLRTILSRDTWLALLKNAGWTVLDPGHVTAVDHFQVPMDGGAAQIQTQFLTATA